MNYEITKVDRREYLDIPGYVGLYSVSRDGRIWDCRGGRHIRCSRDGWGRKIVKLGGKWELVDELWRRGYRALVDIT